MSHKDKYQIAKEYPIPTIPEISMPIWQKIEVSRPDIPDFSFCHSIYVLPVFIENSLGWLGLVLHSFLVDGVCLFIHPSLFQVLRPGHVEGSGPVANSFTVNIGVQGTGVRVKTRLWDRTQYMFVVLQPGCVQWVQHFNQTYTFDAVLHVSGVVRVSLNSQKPLHKAVKHLKHPTTVALRYPLLKVIYKPGSQAKRVNMRSAVD